MKSIVRRDTGEDWQAYVKRLMQEQGVSRSKLNVATGATSRRDSAKR